MLPDSPAPELLSRMAQGTEGSDAAAAELLTLVYDQLHGLAAALFRDQREGGTLQPTALVHEAYLRLVRQEIAWSSRAQFFVVAAKAMRSVLVDHARARDADKRGGGWQRVTLSLAEETPAAEAESAIAPATTVRAIDAALTELAVLDERKARLVELRFFGGLTSEQAADVLGVSRSTVAEDWRMARAWLLRRLEREGV